MVGAVQVVWHGHVRPLLRLRFLATLRVPRMVQRDGDGRSRRQLRRRQVARRLRSVEAADHALLLLVAARTAQGDLGIRRPYLSVAIVALVEPCLGSLDPLAGVRMQGAIPWAHARVRRQGPGSNVLLRWRGGELLRRPAICAFVRLFRIRPATLASLLLRRALGAEGEVFVVRCPRLLAQLACGIVLSDLWPLVGSGMPSAEGGDDDLGPRWPHGERRSRLLLLLRFRLRRVLGLIVPGARSRQRQRTGPRTVSRGAELRPLRPPFSQHRLQEISREAAVGLQRQVVDDQFRRVRRQAGAVRALGVLGRELLEGSLPELDDDGGANGV
mmetsp:Transcript_5054/g.14366  ORF Transcript_5054/g.14366 Transcript_5054/m.14366 type:complete len:329 (-) Transcript_5054:1376-2362(-)